MPVQVQPQRQTRGAEAAAAARVALVVSESNEIWSGGSGQALGDASGEAEGGKHPSALAQTKTCCHSLRMSLERGAFEERSIICGTRWRSQSAIHR